MGPFATKKGPADIPLGKLAFLCFLTAFMSQVSLCISSKPRAEARPDHPERAVWNWSGGGGVRGPFLQAVIMASSPLLSLASTFILLAGASRKNPYLFLPWLLLAFRGLAAVQAPSLAEAACVALKRRRWSEADRRTLALHVVVLALDAAECFCFLQVFRMFRSVQAEKARGDGEREGNEVFRDQQVPVF